MLFEVPSREIFAAQNGLFSDADPSSAEYLPAPRHIRIKTPHKLCLACTHLLMFTLL